MAAVASVVIPAHNEAGQIARNLRTLRSGLDGRELDVVVVCNGCTDDTAAVARAADPSARVIEIAQPSKQAAVRVGNTATAVFPRVHLDADVELSGASVLRLVDQLGDGVEAAAPGRTQPRAGCSPVVRWYYDVWEALPAVTTGLFGRGAVALSAAGQDRIARLPALMGDDLVMSEAFEERERRIVEEAQVIVYPPRTLKDLLRRRIRVGTGNAQAAGAGIRRPESVTGPGTLARLALTRPGLAAKIPVFVAVTLAARIGASRAVARGDFTTWRRDESSRR